MSGTPVSKVSWRVTYRDELDIVGMVNGERHLLPGKNFTRLFIARFLIDMIVYLKLIGERMKGNKGYSFLMLAKLLHKVRVR